MYREFWQVGYGLKRGAEFGLKHLLQACGRLKGFAKVLGEIFSKVYEP